MSFRQTARVHCSGVYQLSQEYLGLDVLSRKPGKHIKESPSPGLRIDPNPGNTSKTTRKSKQHQTLCTVTTRSVHPMLLAVSSGPHSTRWGEPWSGKAPSAAWALSPKAELTWSRRRHGLVTAYSCRLGQSLIHLRTSLGETAAQPSLFRRGILPVFQWPQTDSKLWRRRLWGTTFKPFHSLWSAISGGKWLKHGLRQTIGSGSSREALTVPSSIVFTSIPLWRVSLNQCQRKGTCFSFVMCSCSQSPLANYTCLTKAKAPNTNRW